MACRASRREQVIAATVMPRAGLEAAAAVFLTCYRHPLAGQERKVLPRTAQALTPQDWTTIANVIVPGPAVR